MLAYNKVMYHFHTHNCYDKLYKEGNEIIVNKRFNLGRQYFIKSFSTGVYCVSPDGLKDIPEIIQLLLSHIDTKEKLLDLKSLDDSAYLHNMHNVIKVLSDCSEIIRYAGAYNLETALEETREKHYDYLPSRFNSMFLTDDYGLDYWSKVYDKIPSDLYELSVTGSLFQTSAALTPPIALPHLEMLKLAHLYWNPMFKSEEEKETVEYLFTGKAKVLRKINKEI